VDNVPVDLLHNLLELYEAKNQEQLVAVVVDSRSLRHKESFEVCC